MTETDHNRQKKIALISDLCGFGRSSISAAIPVISALHVQACPVPTAVFSSHTGFPVFSKQDLTAQMRSTIQDWKSIGLRFEGIATGFLGSEEQVDVVCAFLEAFPTAVTLIDPVLGDYGRLYPSVNEELAESIRRLVPYASILTPNLTEACFLTGRSYSDGWNKTVLKEIAEELSSQGPQKIVISGLEEGDRVANYVYEAGHDPLFVYREKVGESRSGTGDVFAAVLAAEAVRGKDFAESVADAAEFIRRALITTKKMGIPLTDGLAIEEHLKDLEEFL